MILTKDQAKAVYSSMCALNNVGGTLKVWFGPNFSNGAHVEDSILGTGVIHVFEIRSGVVTEQETYPDQAAFFLAYEVQT